MVEFGLILPLLLLVLLGIVDFGVLFADKLALRQGAREAARRAAVAAFGTDTACPLTPAPAADDTARLMCLVKTNVDSAHPELVRVKVVFPDVGGYQVGNAVRICAQRQVASVTGFAILGALLDGSRSTTQVDMRVERMTTTLAPERLAAAEETSFPGGWSC